MKNATTLKSNNVNSPKTPGGISKSLLTPCRRLGLSRNWKKSGPSPFVSPLSSNSTVAEENKNVARKRKEPTADENTGQSTNNINDIEAEVSIEIIDKTSSKNVELPRRKKSKTLISTINKSQEDIQSEVIDENTAQKQCWKKPQIDSNHTKDSETVSTPVRTKSKNSKRCGSPLKPASRDKQIDSKLKANDSNQSEIVTTEKPSDVSTPIEQKSIIEEPIYTIKEKSPNELQKECVVVIQRKIFKNIKKDESSESNKSKIPKNTSQIPTSDSDSDEEPLINLHNQNSTKFKTEHVFDNDNDFIDIKTVKPKANKIKETKSPKSKLRTNRSTKLKPEKLVTEQKLSSQDCFDDEDDDFEDKKTILIRKSYDKVTKPIKAKSTGSITQRDIDNLRERIEAKKKLLLAQALTPDTEELRGLIKKWQKGCQDALMELLDLMRYKFPDKERMDYSEMLRTLKIPPSLVGYDSENDCFNSPDDVSIILGQFKDM